MSAFTVKVIEIDEFDLSEKSYENNFKYKSYKSACFTGQIVEIDRSELAMSWLQEILLDTIEKEELDKILFGEYDKICLLLKSS